MTTTVTLTGTGVPHPAPGRAGSGTLVRHGEASLQFDAGRGTVIRLVEAGCEPNALAAVFVTHVHSDHVVGLADVVMTHWVLQQMRSTEPLTVVTPEGMPARFVTRMLEPYDDDIALRMAHVQPEGPRHEVLTFAVPAEPAEVWVSADGAVRVEAVAVHHEPVPDAVAYRVRTPDATVVISGDTRVCAEVERLATGADLLVHEACRATPLAPVIAGTRFEQIFSYHADTVPLGGLAARAGVPHVVLTHLIPAPETPEQEATFVQDLRDGGYTGRVTVGRDLMAFGIG